EQVEYTPARLVLIEHVQPKFTCRACNLHVVIAPRRSEPIDTGLPGTGQLAHAITSKFTDHLPLYRLEDVFGRQDVDLSRSTICGWLVECTLKPTGTAIRLLALYDPWSPSQAALGSVLGSCLLPRFAARGTTGLLRRKSETTARIRYLSQSMAWTC